MNNVICREVICYSKKEAKKEQLKLVTLLSDLEDSFTSVQCIVRDIEKGGESI